MSILKKTVISSIVACMLLVLSMPVFAATSADWYEVKGTYAKNDNSQYNNGVLSLMYLDNDVVMFEFFIMEGSESKDTSNNFCLAGAFNLDDNGIGIYEHPKTEDVKINFTLTKGGVSVKQIGKLPIAVSGEYRFVENNIKVTEDVAVEILEQLATATTSLNHNNGEYKLVMSEEMVNGWFYDVNANFVDTNALIAEFYIASDMSAVYRVDTDTPILIWGSARPMLDATYLADSKSLFGITSDENNVNSNGANEDDNYVETNYVSVSPKNDAIKIGDSTPIVVTVPGMLNYTLICKSSNPEIAKIDDKGVITAASDGEAIISGMITIDGEEKPFKFTVSSFEEKAASPEVFRIPEFSVMIGSSVYGLDWANVRENEDVISRAILDSKGKIFIQTVANTWIDNNSGNYATATDLKGMIVSSFNGEVVEPTAVPGPTVIVTP